MSSRAGAGFLAAGLMLFAQTWLYGEFLVSIWQGARATRLCRTGRGEQMKPRLVVPVILDGPLEPIEEPAAAVELEVNVSDCNGSECNTTENATAAAREPTGPFS